MPPPAMVLVVDDNEDALAATALILERGGYRVSRAADGQQALDLARTLRPAVILLDVLLPDISGLEVLRQIRADPDLTASSVILFSARATDPEQQAGGLDAGADDYIAKPVKALELIARVRAEIRHRELTEALRASEARYRDLVETSHDLIWAVDAEGRITFLNQACRTMYGREPEEMIGRRFLDFAPADQAARDAAIFAEALQSGNDTAGYTSRMYAKDGHEVILNADARDVRDAEGRVVGTTGISRDVTELQRSLQALRASEERFRLLSKATSDALWDWDLVTNALWRSEGFETLFGFTRAEVEPTIDSWYNRIHPDDKDVAIASIHAAIASGDDAWSWEYRFLRKDGSHLYVRDSGHVIRDHDGTPIRMIGGMTDVTERKRAEERLAEQAALLDAAHEAIMVKDLDDRIVYWNAGAEATFGWSAAEAIGQRSRELLHLDQARFDVAHEALLVKGRWQGELLKRSKPGREVTVDARWTLLLDREGRPKSVLAFNADTTERKRMERHFLRAQRLESLGTLAGGIAHDLNNALAPVLMAIEILKEDQPDPAKLDTLAILESSVKRSADMVRQVLTFARGSEGKWAMINILTLVREVNKIVAETFPKNIDFTLNIEHDPWPIRADATQLHQVLLNLCVNARDAMPSGGRITVKVKNLSIDEIYAGMNPEARPGPYVVLRVEDTGTGMPPEVLDRIFEPFYTTKESGRGTGLGLATTHSIVQGHGGFIHVYSEMGRGTTFKVYLPAEATAEAVESTAVAQTTLPRGHGEMILVVDDEQHIRLIAEKTLTRFGYRVRLAGNGAEAVSVYAMHRQEIAAVLTDMAMPVMDGPALIVALKAINPAVRIIGSSGLDANGLVAKAVAAGVESFVPKPYTAEALLKVLAALFGRAS